MKINHGLICDIIRWLMFVIFSVAIGKKLYSIYKYGGNIKKHLEEQSPAYPVDNPVPYDYDNGECKKASWN